LRPGLSLPIRIVSRGQESGTRRTFEHNFLDGVTKPKLSLDTCMNPERDPQAPTTRCERSSTAAVLHRIAARPGAIGYADAPTAKVATAKSQSLTALLLDDRYPDITSVDAGYRFWTFEYLYTKGVPANDSVLKKFIDYLRSGTARAELQQAGYTPRIAKDGLLHPLCVHGVA
jgi:ABC-type phosphate transport system substrate-binding protein